MRAAGNATQSRENGGWVKAMALIDPYQSNPIQQCYNSRLPGTNATSGDCGFTVNLGSGSNYWRTIDFGFKVDDRFVMVTPFRNPTGDISAELIPGGTQNQWSVMTFYSSVNYTGNDAQWTYAKFFIVVY